MSSDEIAIRVREVSKHFLLFDRPQDRLKQSIVPRLQRLLGLPSSRYFRDFAALNAVSFDVRRGETIGIVGRNGSGKSTLLQVICGTLRANTGSVEVHGRVAALLELGAGFNPEFTGRENVYLNGAIMGLSRAEIDDRFDAIAAFADIGEFIDQPVKTYSSGMFVRLAFAAAINVEPHVLVVDEALSVGDEAFQRKCFARIEQLQGRGTTILFVTHSATLVVQLCSRALLLDRGELLLDGAPKLVTSQYQRLVNATGEEAAKVRLLIRSQLGNNDRAESGDDRRQSDHSVPTESCASAPNPPAPRCSSVDGYEPSLVSACAVEYESRGAHIREPQLLRLSGEPVNILEMGHRYMYQYVVDFTRDADDVGFGMMVNTVQGLNLAGATTSLSRSRRLGHVAAGTTMQVQFEFVCALTPGVYFLNAGTTGAIAGHDHGYLHRLLDWITFRVVSPAERIATGLVNLDARPRVVPLPRSVAASTPQQA